MKLFEIFEGSSSDFMTNEEDILKWFSDVLGWGYEKLGHVHVLPDGRVRMPDGGLNVTGRLIKELPFRFTEVRGDFNISANNLSTLEGCPEKVYGKFSATHNARLTSYKFLPKEAMIVHLGNDNVTTFEDVDWSERTIQRLIFDTRKIASHGLGLLQISGLKTILDDKYIGSPLPKNETLAEPFYIISKYLGRPDDIFECQAELIEAGFEEHAKL